MKDALSQLMWYLPALWRRRWMIISIAWALCAVGWVAVAFVPNEYRVSAKVHIDTESLLRPLLRGLAIDVNPAQQIDLMQRTLISRTNLERVTRMTDLDLPAQSEEEMARLLASLQDRISLSAGQGNIFTISFMDQEPATAYKVVQALLSIYMENNAGNTRRDFDSARQFLESQLRKYEQQMADAERRLNDFKSENLDYLPGNTTFVDHMNRTRSQVVELRDRLGEAKARASELERQLENVPQYVTMDGPNGPPSGLQVRILELQQRLDDLLLHYTPKHPDVIATQRLLAQLQAEMEAELSAFASGGPPGTEGEGITAASAEDGSGAGSEPGPNQVQSDLYQNIKMSLVDAEAQVAALQNMLERRQSDLSALEAEVEQMPKIQAQLDRLARDYNLARRNYEELLQRRETAVLSESREMNAEKVQFRVIDPPQMPVLPAGFKRPLLLTAVLVAGVGAGLGLAVLLVSMQSSFVSTIRLAQVLGRPVLGSISMVTHEGRLSRATRVAAFGSALSALVAVYAGLMVVEHQVGLPDAMPSGMKERVVEQVQPLLEKL